MSVTSNSEIDFSTDRSIGPTIGFYDSVTGTAIEASNPPDVFGPSEIQAEIVQGYQITVIDNINILGHRTFFRSEHDRVFLFDRSLNQEIRFTAKTRGKNERYLYDFHDQSSRIKIFLTV